MARKKQVIHASGLVEVKITVGKTFDGKRIQKSFYGSSKLDAKKKADEYKLSLEVANATGEAFIQKKYTFEEWALKWLETYKKPNVSENTYLFTYENTVSKHLIPYFGKANLIDIRPIDVQTFFATKSKMSETMLEKMLLCLRDIFETAIDNDLCFKNPARKVSYTSQATKSVKKVYTTEQIELVKNLSINKFNEIVVLLSTGIRRGELLGLMWEDIDTSTNVMSIQRSIAASKTTRIKINPPKWNSYRSIPLTSEVISLINNIPRISDYIFPLPDGRVQNPNSWSEKLERFMKSFDSNIPKLTAHELKHTSGTELRRQGVDIYTIQKIMGHKDIKMTTELYVHNEIDELKKAMNI